MTDIDIVSAGDESNDDSDLSECTYFPNLSGMVTYLLERHYACES